MSDTGRAEIQVTLTGASNSLVEFLAGTRVASCLRYECIYNSDAQCDVRVIRLGRDGSCANFVAWPELGPDPEVTDGQVG